MLVLNQLLQQLRVEGQGGLLLSGRLYLALLQFLGLQRLSLEGSGRRPLVGLLAFLLARVGRGAVVKRVVLRAFVLLRLAGLHWSALRVVVDEVVFLKGKRVESLLVGLLQELRDLRVLSGLA